MSKKRVPIPKVRKPESKPVTDLLADKRSPGLSLDIDYANTTSVSKSINDKLSSNEEILDLFPDVEISIQILVSSILAPNDLLSSKLSYNLPDLEIPSNSNALITECIRGHVNANYKLEDKLSTIVRESLFTKGAYAELIIPSTNILAMHKEYTDSGLSTEAMLDNMNASTGVFKSDTGPVKITVETMSGTDPEIELSNEDLNISFTEDIQSIRVSEYISTSLSTEAKGYINTKNSFKSLMHKKRSVSGVRIITSDNSEGTPMSMKLPVESVLPVHMSNDPTKHIGYLVLLDNNGVPVINNKSLDTSANSNEGSKTIDIKSAIITKASKALTNKLNNDVKLTNTDEIYTKALISSIQNKISDSNLGGKVNIPETSDVYQMVFSRAMAGLKTRLLYVPKTNLSYIAFDYRSNGTGRSLLEKSSMLFSIRAANLFTRMMANVKNSITTTKISAELDPNDMDPEHTRELIIEQAMRTEQAKFPIGMTNVKDLVNWMHSVGYRFDIKHASLPDISIDISDDTRSIAEPDTEFDNMIQEHIIMSFGLKKDLVMSGYDADFATTVVANNVLFAKRISDNHNILNPQLGNYVKIVLTNDSILKEKVSNIILDNVRSIRSMINKSLSSAEKLEYKEFLSIDENIVEYVYDEYVNNLTVTLPKVEISRSEGSTDGLDTFVEMLDTYLPMIISEESLPEELVGTISGRMESVISAIKTILIKNWIDDRNFLPELTKFLTVDNQGKPRYDLLGEYSDFTTILSNAVIPYLKKAKRASNKLDVKIDKIDSDDGTDDPEPIDSEDNNDSVDDTANANDNAGDNEEAASDSDSLDDTEEPEPI